MKEFGEYDSLTLIVKVFANIDGLAYALVKQGRIGRIADFRIFVAEFNNRLPFCDFVDVGHGIERADNGVRGMNPFQKQILVPDSLIRSRKFEVLCRELAMQAGFTCLLL